MKISERIRKLQELMPNGEMSQDFFSFPPLMNKTAQGRQTDDQLLCVWFCWWLQQTLRLHQGLSEAGQGICPHPKTVLFCRVIWVIFLLPKGTTIAHTWLNFILQKLLLTANDIADDSICWEGLSCLQKLLNLSLSENRYVLFWNSCPVTVIHSSTMNILWCCQWI